MQQFATRASSRFCLRLPLSPVIFEVSFTKKGNPEGGKRQWITRKPAVVASLDLMEFFWPTKGCVEGKSFNYKNIFVFHLTVHVESDNEYREVLRKLIVESASARNGID